LLHGTIMEPGKRRRKRRIHEEEKEAVLAV
jgi:hypothetical protein